MSNSPPSKTETTRSGPKKELAINSNGFSEKEGLRTHPLIATAASSLPLLPNPNRPADFSP